MHGPRLHYVLVAVILVVVGTGHFCAAQTLSGSVYVGSVGTTSQPLSGVTIYLYGSNKSTSLGVQIDKTSTDANGKYILDAGKIFEIYTIIEEDPAGYVSVGASSVGGTVIDDNTIRYTQLLAGKELAKNNFWDKAEQQVNRAPVADAGGPYAGYVGEWITFDGSQSYDPDQDDKIVDWRWDMDGDGQYDDASGVTTTWQWNAPTSGTVGLRVMDTRQATDTDTAAFEVKVEFQNRPPVADAGGPYSGSVGEWITFDGSKSYDPDQGDGIVSWYWDMDGDGHDDATGDVVHWKWDEAASGRVRLTVVDAHNATNMVFVDYSIVEIYHNYDWGDAPSDAGFGHFYPTLRIANGARHRVGDLYLGQRIDADADGQPNLAALGDDADADGDDEDGITFVTEFTPGQVVRLNAVVTNDKDTEQPVTMACWVDTDRNGTWHISDEHMDSWFPTVPPGVSTWSLSFRLPADAVPGSTYMRFRLYPRHPMGPAYLIVPTGSADDGEVEDRMVEIREPQPIWDYGDAPDPNYPTLLASDGARHRVRAGLSLGARVDAELDAVPHLVAVGDDDTGGPDDEDGVTFPRALVPGNQAMITFNVHNDTGEDQEVTVAGWVDFDRNRVWDNDEVVVFAGPVMVHSGIPAAWARMVPVPIDAVLGRTYARFRLYRVERNSAGEVIAPGVIPTGDGGAGEVEDYALIIGEVIHSERLYEDIGWTTEGGWAFGVPLGGGGSTFGYPDPDSGYTGRSVYGVNLSGDYELLPGEMHFLTAGPFDCSEYSEVTLGFGRWLNSDAGATVANTVQASGNGGAWHVLWQSPETLPVTDEQWQWVEYDISGIAPGNDSVYLRWGYQIKPGANPYSGWNIDDVTLWGVRNDPVHFVNARLKAAVEGALSLSDPTPRDMLALASLEVEGADIVDLTGLEYAVNLQTLHLSDNLIHEIGPLAGLVNLTELELGGNTIVDVGPLAGLIGLRTLSLGDNHVHDASPLAGLTQLTYLGLVRNFVEDISALAGMTQLEQAWLNLNWIVDISPLEDLTHLTILVLDNNRLSDRSCRVSIPIIRANNPGIWLQSSCPP